MKYFDQQNLVLHCSSFSKTLGSGFRMGWVYAGKFSEHIQHLQLMSTISANALIQNALVEFLAHHHYEKHLRTLRRSLEKNKKQFFQYLKQHLPEGCKVYNYPSGYFLWIQLPQKVSSMQIYELLIQQQIGIAPSPLFNVLPSHQHFIRMNCSFEWTEKIQHAVDQFILAIEKEISI
ncbi:bifunctional transcriptional regulator /amino transferase [Acinetobacter junii]|nr:bifunctional transcriptional regulator /amino transferase [Acinetobacter junii]